MTPDHHSQPSRLALVARASALAAGGERRILGIAGPPGAGKSTLARQLCEALPGAAVVVPMDGFHRANDELVALGLRDRKGAPETFDVEAFVALLGVLRSREDVRAPDFDRDLDRVVPDAIVVPGDVPLVVTEGNYLLLDLGPWRAIRGSLDEAWYLAGDERRVERLVARHVAHGRSPADARAWVLRSDEANTRLVAPSASRADVVIAGLPVE